MQSGLLLYKSMYENLFLHFMVRPKILTWESTVPRGATEQGDEGDDLFNIKQQMNTGIQSKPTGLPPESATQNHQTAEAERTSEVKFKPPYL